MEKDSARHYRAYEGFKPANNGNTSSLKRSTSDRSKTHPSRQVRCLCFGGVPDKASQHSFLKGCIINLGICALLVAYTLLGSFIFLAIEGGTDAGIQQRTLATTIAENQPTRRNTTAWLKQVSAQLLISTRRFFFPFFPPAFFFFFHFAFHCCIFTVHMAWIFVTCHVTIHAVTNERSFSLAMFHKLKRNKSYITCCYDRLKRGHFVTFHSIDSREIFSWYRHFCLSNYFVQNIFYWKIHRR